MKKPTPVPLQMFDPRRGDVAFKIEPIGAPDFRDPRRANYFTVLWLHEGRGTFHVDLQGYPFTAPALLFANPYQTFFLETTVALGGESLQFHANFFCIETYHEQVGCNGVLFNDVYGQPVLPLDAVRVEELGGLVAQMKAELGAAGLAHSELLVSYLKVFLIKATRSKLEQQAGPATSPAPRLPEVLERLTTLIEEQYRQAHGPAEYATPLHISPKALGKLVKTHFGRTLTGLIRERILKDAKWQLLHTRKPVKEIAAELGFDDELYFSRLFKRGTGNSPSAFREFETAIRSGRNLSM